MASELEQIVPSTKNVSDFQNVLYRDYLRIGISEPDALTMTFGPQNEQSEEVLKEMQIGSLEYLGLRTNNKLAAAAIVGDWLYADMEPFLSKPDFIAARLLHKTAVIFNRDPATHDGLFAFGIADDVNYETTSGAVLTELRNRTAAKGRIGLRAAIDTEDINLLTIFEREGRQIVPRPATIPIRGVKRNYLLYEIETA